MWIIPSDGGQIDAVGALPWNAPAIKPSAGAKLYVEVTHHIARAKLFQTVKWFGGRGSEESDCLTYAEMTLE